MELTLYTNRSSNNTLNKVLEDESQHITAMAHNIVDRLHPIFILKGEVTRNYLKWNSRYYYVTPVYDGNKTFLNCSIDPLMSNASEIKQLKVRAVSREDGGFSNISSNVTSSVNKTPKLFRSTNLLARAEAGERSYVLITN